MADVVQVSAKGEGTFAMFEGKFGFPTRRVLDLRCSRIFGVYGLLSIESCLRIDNEMKLRNHPRQRGLLYLPGLEKLLDQKPVLSWSQRYLFKPCKRAFSNILDRHGLHASLPHFNLSISVTLILFYQMSSSSSRFLLS